MYVFLVTVSIWLQLYKCVCVCYYIAAAIAVAATATIVATAASHAPLSVPLSMLSPQLKLGEKSDPLQSKTQVLRHHATQAGFLQDLPMKTVPFCSTE